MFKKIIDIVFWAAFLSTMVHFYIWLVAKEGGDQKLAKEMFDLIFISGGIGMIAFWFTKPNDNID